MCTLSHSGTPANPPGRGLLPLAQLADGGNLRDGLGQLGLGLGEIHRSRAIGQRFLGQALGFQRLGLVQVMARTEVSASTVTMSGWTSIIPPDT